MSDMRGSVRGSLLWGLLALVLVSLFLVRRVAGPPAPGAPAFDPAEYRDVPTLSVDEAAEHTGDRARVCGRVAATNFAGGVTGRPTFLNLSRPYPDQPFDVVVWGQDRQGFSMPPEVAYRGERICVLGRITEHEGVPRIEVREPAQIDVR